MKNLDKKVIWIFFFGKLLWSSLVVFIAVGDTILTSVSDSNLGPSGFSYFFVTFLMVILACVINLIVSFLSYKFYKYELADDAYHAEKGIIAKKYISIPYDRIQNVDIHRSLLDRILGLSDLDIQTAGRSSSGFATEGRLPGISQSEAVKLRDELIKKAKSSHRNL